MGIFSSKPRRTTTRTTAEESPIFMNLAKSNCIKSDLNSEYIWKEDLNHIFQKCRLENIEEKLKEQEEQEQEEQEQEQEQEEGQEQEQEQEAGGEEQEQEAEEEQEAGEEEEEEMEGFGKVSVYFDFNIFMIALIIFAAIYFLNQNKIINLF